MITKVLRQYIEGEYTITEYTRDGDSVAFTIKTSTTESGGDAIEIPKSPLVALQEKFDDLILSADQKYKSLNLETADMNILRSAKIAQLKEQCTQTIYDGFKSASTGHEFGFNDIDQANFAQQYLLVVSGDNAGTDIKWKTKSGVATMTEEQFRVVVKESKDHKMANQMKYWTLESKVLQATTNEAIHSVVW